MFQQRLDVFVRDEVEAATAQVALARGVELPVHGAEAARVALEVFVDALVEAAELGCAFFCGLLAGGAAEDVGFGFGLGLGIGLLFGRGGCGCFGGGGGCFLFLLFLG